MNTLLDIFDDYQDWRENMLVRLADSASALLIDDVLALRDPVEQLQNIDPPKSFGRD